jgi:hypothetical protein
MPGITVTEQIDALLTTTLKNYQKKLEDNFFNDFPTLKFFRSKGRVQRESGGAQIVEHVLYESNSTIRAVSGYELLDTTPQEGMTQAFYNWKEYAGTISISRKEERQNSGKHKLLSLLEAKTTQAEQTLKYKVTTDFFANISSTPTKAIDGIFLHASNSPSTTTLGAISGLTYSWWRNYATSVGTYAANLEASLRTGYNNCSGGGGDFADAIICSQTALEYYESLSVTQKRYVDEQMSADLGFRTLTYKGAKMFWDGGLATNIPSTGETMILVNTKHSRLVIDTESDFVITPFQTPDNQLARVAKILVMLNFCTAQRRKLGLLYGITA